MAFSGSGASSRQTRSHGLPTPVSRAVLTSEKAPSSKRSTSRSIFFLRPPKGPALVFGTISWRRAGRAPPATP
jgi:hypothetical protein